MWQHIHAQHGNELVKNKVRFNKTRFTMRQTCVCEMVKGTCEISEFCRESPHGLKSELIR